ncbi:glycosyltransferase [Pedobacter sp. BAL39]|nr:glycosyltransferase [Pedobacter sp. BAL39]
MHVHAFRSESDKGIYDAMNKGIALATGDVVGMLNADDYFADEDCVRRIAATFENTQADMVYADLDYVDVAGKVLRQWRSGAFQRYMFHWGWMPPHPTFYARRILFERWGDYSLFYGTAADFELMVRFLYVHGGVVGYLNKVTVKMVAGGVSNGDFRSRIAAWKNDYRAMKKARLPLPLISALLKPLRKIAQFFPVLEKR